MKTAHLLLAAAALAPWAGTAFAAPPGGGGAGHGAHPGGTYGRPVQPIYRPGHPGVRPPGYRPGYPGYGPGYRPGYGPGYRPGYWPGYRPGYWPGWNAGYWGPGGGWYYGGPGYWGAWPYAAAWGFGLGSYAVGYPYAATPLVVDTANQPQVYVEQETPAAAPAPHAAPAADYWYYCTQPAGYFPYVKDCHQPWLKVLPQVPGEQVSPPQLVR